MQANRIPGLAANSVLALSLSVGPGVAFAQPQKDGTGWPQFRGSNVDGIST